MKYQKPLVIAGGITVAVALAIWIRRGLIEAGGAKTANVTATATGGQAQTALIKTTPIQTSSVAVAAPKSTLALLAESGGKVLSRAASLVLPVTTNRLQPNGNPASNAAAYASPIRPQYAPTPYANLKPR